MSARATARSRVTCSGVEPKAFDSRVAISTDTPVCPFNKSESGQMSFSRSAVQARPPPLNGRVLPDEPPPHLRERSFDLPDV